MHGACSLPRTVPGDEHALAHGAKRPITRHDQLRTTSAHQDLLRQIIADDHVVLLAAALADHHKIGVTGMKQDRGDGLAFNGTPFDILAAATPGGFDRLFRSSGALAYDVLLPSQERRGE